MAAPTNTLTTVAAIGNREDLENDIYRISPEETPFSSNIGKTKATAITHEWIEEALATPNADNASLEGDGAGTLDAAVTKTRIKNICQIFKKTGGVSRTQEVVDKAGRDSDMDRDKMLKGIELRRDMEARWLGNKASVAESGSTPRASAGALAFLTTATSRGATGTNGGYSAGIVAAAGNGTQRTFTEALVKGVLATGFSAGAKYSQAYMGITHKQQFGAFTGIADIRADVSGKGQATIYGAADVYVTDTGAITLIPVQYGLTRDCLFIDPKYWAVATLDGVKSKALPVSGDSEAFMLTAEKTLVCRNQKGGAVVADLT